MPMPKVRVRLCRVTDNRAVEIDAGGDPLHVSGGGEQVELTGPVSVSRRVGRWRVEGRDIPRTIAGANDIEVRADGPMTVSGKQGRTYSGFIRCVADTDPPRADFSIINIVDMSTYIPGVLAGELYEGWHDAAFEAQAIAARSYAAFECNHRVSRSWDVLDTAASQVYVGIPTWDQAGRCAKATEGLVLTWEGEVIPGYFSSCCGGRAATATDAVGPNPINRVPPLRGHGGIAKCMDAPRYRWSGHWDAARVGRAIRAWGRRSGQGDIAVLGAIKSIRPTDPNEHGRPTRLEVVTATGSSSIRCVDLPGVFAGAGLDPLSSGWVGGDVSGGVLTVKGRGFGHGVGLCQYGAESMASHGSTRRKIIDFYYPGVAITKAW
jgi:stage II sporulation protein D